MMLHIPTMQLQHQLARDHKAFVVRPTMRTLTIEQSLIPTTTRFNIAHTNQWLWTHKCVCGVTIKAQPRLRRTQVAARESTLARIDIEGITRWSRWLRRLVTSSQLIAIHILLVGYDTWSRPVPPNERESDFL